MNKAPTLKEQVAHLETGRGSKIIETVSGTINVRIQELNSRIATAHQDHDRLLAVKREELLEIIRQCMEAIHTAAMDNDDVKSVFQMADHFYDDQRRKMNSFRSMVLLDCLVSPIIQYRDQTMEKIEGRIIRLSRLKSTVGGNGGNDDSVFPIDLPSSKKVIRQRDRKVLFP